MPSFEDFDNELENIFSPLNNLALGIIGGLSLFASACIAGSKNTAEIACRAPIVLLLGESHDTFREALDDKNVGLVNSASALAGSLDPSTGCILVDL